MNLPLALLHEARMNGYAVGAFNMHNEETTQALLLAAEDANAPVFLQVGRAIIPHMGVRNAFQMTKRIAKESNAVYVIHLDHGSYEEVLDAIKLGFTSVMYDGAHLPFEENIKTTRRIVEIAHEFGVVVEAELGRIPDADQPVEWASFYTDVHEAERFAETRAANRSMRGSRLSRPPTRIRPTPKVPDVNRAALPIGVSTSVRNGVSGSPG